MTTPRTHSHARTSLLIACGCLLAAELSHAAAWTSGHGDIGIAYEDEGSGSELHLHLHLGEESPAIINGSTIVADEEFEAGDLNININNPSVVPGTATPAFLAGVGTTIGSTIYSLPASESVAGTAGVPFLGFGTEELDPVNWPTGLTLTLNSVSGPGDFSLYRFDDPGFTFFMSTADGIDGSDALPLTADNHEHFNLAFTEAGIYEVTFTASGTHLTDGLVSSTETFTFAIPEPSTGLLSGLAGLLALARRRRA